MEQPSHIQQINHGKNLDLILTCIIISSVKGQNGYKIEEKMKKGQNYFFKQNKSTFTLHKPCNNDHLKILEAAGRDST